MITESTLMQNTAIQYLQSGMCVIPDRQDKKSPAIDWKKYQNSMSTEEEIKQWFPKYRIGIVCGAVSGHLELIDFDSQGEAFDKWKDFINEDRPELINKLIIERSPSGGYHVIYRCNGVNIPGNTKLALKGIEVDEAGINYEYKGKTLKSIQCADGKAYIVAELIETRGEGGQFLCAPNRGYQLLQGNYRNIPNISFDERETIISCARACNEWYPPVIQDNKNKNNSKYNDVSPADEYNLTCNMEDLLKKHGWTKCHSKGENTYYCRPGKDKRDGHSASVRNDGVFFVFTSGVAQFESFKAYSPFQTYAILEHHGDQSAAATAILKSRPKDYTKQNYNTPTPLQMKHPSEPPANHWPDIETSEMRVSNPRPRPSVLIEGLAFAGSKISFTAPSKARKTFTQMHMGICIASGQKWHSFNTIPGRVLYVNLELSPYSFEERERAIYRAMQIDPSKDFDVWHLRGLHVTIEQLQEQMKSRVKHGEYALICFDPLYKVLAGRNENAANEMGDLLNRLESIGHEAGSSLLVTHHFTKGNASGKEAIDRAAGSGVIGRDADAMITLTPHEQDDCFTMECIVRDFAPIDPLVLRWEYPLFKEDIELNPDDLKQPGQKAPITDDQVLAQVPTTPTIRGTIEEAIREATGRGFNSVQAAFSRVYKKGLIKVEQLPRQNARPVLRFYKV